MFTSKDYHRLKYHFVRGSCKGEEIEELVGFDSEADTSGRPFLFCFSDGRSCSPENLILFLFENYKNTNFAVWNLKYDSGAVLYDMPPGAIIYGEDGVTIKRFTPGKYELWTTNKTTWKTFQYLPNPYHDGERYPLEFQVEYIPHKFLKLAIGRNFYVKFWDVCQFYQSSLDVAARTYLGERKKDIETKKFTSRYIGKNREKIVQYCIHDATLTARLGNHLLKKLSDFGLRVTALYSQASISFRYFQDNGDIIGISRFISSNAEFLKAAIDSYEGGKFEVISRGYVPLCYEYDIISAYPFEIAFLADISRAKIIKGKRYRPESHYAFMRCRIVIYESVAVPCGLLLENTRIYAIGSYFAAITKGEYEYLISLGAEVEILQGYYVMLDKIQYPYHDRVMRLFELKKEYKKKDTMLYLLCKVMLNGFYGKFAQAIEDWRGDINGGVGFNPIYASVITANVRLKVCKVQNYYKEKCFAVHTDSVILSEPLSKDFAPEAPGLGDFEYVDKGAGLLIACGCYQINEDGAFKGFEPREKKYYGGMSDKERALFSDGKKIYENWYDILKRYKGRTDIPYKALRVESWVEATSKGHFDKINKFQNMPKVISLNADIKRIWKNDAMTAADYLRELHTSEPRTIVQREPPEFWEL
jgi:hypothetical protein